MKILRILRRFLTSVPTTFGLLVLLCVIWMFLPPLPNSSSQISRKSQTALLKTDQYQRDIFPPAVFGVPNREPDIIQENEDNWKGEKIADEDDDGKFAKRRDGDFKENLLWKGKEERRQGEDEWNDIVGKVEMGENVKNLKQKVTVERRSPERKPRRRIHRFSKDVTEEKGCVYPHLDPFDETLHKYIRYPSELKCTQVSEFGSLPVASSQCK